MRGRLSHEALDAAFAFVAERADALVLCDAAPSTAEKAATPASEGGRALGAVAMATGLRGGDYAVAAGDVSGRKLVVSPQSAVAVSETGLATHIALLETDGGAPSPGEPPRRARRLLLVTALSTPVAVTAGSVVSLDGFDDEIRDSA